MPALCRSSRALLSYSTRIRNVSRSLWQFRISGATFSRQMFIPCAREIFYYHGSVRIVSTNRMRAQDADLVGVPGLEIVATSWKQRTATLPNSRYGGGPPFVSRVARHAPLATRHYLSLAAVAANRYGSTNRNRHNPLQTKEKRFSNRYENALSGSPVTNHQSHD